MTKEHSAIVEALTAQLAEKDREIERLCGEAEVADEQLAQLRGFATDHKDCDGKIERLEREIRRLRNITDHCPACKVLVGILGVGPMPPLPTDEEMAVDESDEEIERLTRERASAIDRLTPLGLDNERLRDALGHLLDVVSPHEKERCVACQQAQQMLEDESPASEPGAPQAPIAKITVQDKWPYPSVLSTLYAPGLPPGEHDVYCEPVAPYLNSALPAEKPSHVVTEDSRSMVEGAVPCRIVEYDGAYRCFTHKCMWGAVSNPAEACPGWSAEKSLPPQVDLDPESERILRENAHKLYRR